MKLIKLLEYENKWMPTIEETLDPNSRGYEIYRGEYRHSLEDAFAHALTALKGMK